VAPEARIVEVWRAGGLVRIVTVEEELAGEEVLPGFAVAVADLFR